MMNEGVKLLSGTVEYYYTADNDDWKFYKCGIYNKADELRKTFEHKGIECEVGLHRVYGWYVKVRR